MWYLDFDCLAYIANTYYNQTQLEVQTELLQLVKYMCYCTEVRAQIDCNIHNSQLKRHTKNYLLKELLNHSE